MTRRPVRHPVCLYRAQALRGIERRTQPFNVLPACRPGPALHQNHVKTTGRRTCKTHQVVACRKYNALLFETTDAGASATVRFATALANLYKHQRAVRPPHDEVYLPAAPTRCSIIGLYQLKAGLEQVIKREGFCSVAPALGGKLNCHPLRSIRQQLLLPLRRLQCLRCLCNLFPGKPH